MQIWEKKKTTDGHELHETYIHTYRLALYRDSAKSFNIQIQHMGTKNMHTIWHGSIPAKNTWDAQDKAYETLQNILTEQKTELSKSLKALNNAIQERQPI